MHTTQKHAKTTFSFTMAIALQVGWDQIRTMTLFKVAEMNALLDRVLDSLRLPNRISARATDLIWSALMMITLRITSPTGFSSTLVQTPGTRMPVVKTEI